MDGIGKKISLLMRVARKKGKALYMSMNDWEIEWANTLGPSADVRPQCDDFEYQFEVGDLVKVAPGFYEKKLRPGDLGVVVKRIVMYCNQVKSDGPAYKVAWQQDKGPCSPMREFKLVPVKKSK